ncbi:hypothetical protein ACWCPF_36490 [Streptomyces sp. NPDC001858]
MSDEPSTERSAELSIALREFAAQAETAPVLSGAEVRARAVRRARRRLTAALGATATALALVAFALTADFTADEDGKRTGTGTGAAVGKQRETPSAKPAGPPPSPSAPVPVPVGTLDLDRRTLTVEDRTLGLSSEYIDPAGLTGPLTVYRKYDTKALTVTDLSDGSRHVLDITYAVELRDARDQRVYVGFSFAFDVHKDDAGGDGHSWIDLKRSDAEWFHTVATTGTSFSLGG